jgi:hypothetical protein
VVQSASDEVTTPSCASRLRMGVVPSRLGVGRPANVRVADMWRLGAVSATVCVTPPGGAPRCRPIRIAGGRARVRSRMRLSRPGLWTVRLLSPYGQRVARTVDVRGDPPLRLFASGDSMIFGFDEKLRAALGASRVSVFSDPRPATGLSKPLVLDWGAHAQRTAQKIRPDVTVVFLGANDGFPFRVRPGVLAQCCDASWIAQYARRVRTVMRWYLRGGRALVYWVLLPAPREPALATIFAAVNAGIRRAAPSFADGVKLIDLGAVIAPSGQFEEQITYHGRTGVVVRSPDGIHLAGAGAEIASSLVLGELRRDGMLSR